jgi:uncharacterized protein (TIGR02265 family)
MANGAAPKQERILGSVLLARLEFVRAKGGPSGVDKILTQLPAADQAVLKGQLWDGGLYPLELNLRLDQVIAATLSPKNPDQIFLEMGRASAETNLNGAQKVFVIPGEPQRFLAMAPRIYSFYYSVGYRTYEKLGPNAAVLRTFDAGTVTPGDCLTVVGWHQRALELCGAKDVTVTEPKCRNRGAALCEYRCEWRSVEGGPR